MPAKRLLKFAATLMLVSALGACAPEKEVRESTRTSADADVSVIPLPRTIVPQEGHFQLQPETPVVYAGEEARRAAEYFRDLAQGFAISVAEPVPQRDRSGAIRFRLAPGNSVAGEYSLSITAAGVDIEAATRAGLFYGAVTLWQLLTDKPGPAQTIELPALRIHDTPRFAWRGLMLDSARHYQSPEFIKRFIDAMALHKFNVLHWHLTDDQAWRIEIKRYPRLTDVGAWRVPAGDAPRADIDPATGNPRLYGGFYSQDTVRELVAYAAARHITIVPEIEMPGHASAAIAAYPELATAKPLEAVPADWGVYPHVYNVEEATFTFFTNVLDEVIELFPSEYIHVGGDEAVKHQWRDSAATQARMRALGIKDEASLQSYFIQRIEQHLNKRGRRLIGWDEILEGGLAPNATVMSWRGIEGAVAAAKLGHDTVLSPAPTLYLDNRQFADDASPGRQRVISLEDVYRFDPTPREIPESQRQHILGLQANLWSEHIRTEARMEYMAWPRAAAVAEIAWSPPDALNFASFSARMQTHLQRLERRDIRYARPPADRTRDPVKISHDLKLCSEHIALSLEDDAPREGGRATFMVDIMNPCWMASDVDLSAARAMQVKVGQVPFNFQIGRDIEKVNITQSDGVELQVRVGSCDSPVIARVPVRTESFTVSDLPPVTLPVSPAPQDICLRFAQPGIDPIWVIHSIGFEPASVE